MKKLLGVMFFVVVSISMVQAQFSIGGKIGINHTKVTATDVISDNIPMDARNGFEAMIPVAYEITPDLSIVSGLGYSRRGFDIKQGTDFNLFGLDIPLEAKAEVHIDYMELPVLFKYTVGPGATKAYAMAGATAAYASGGFVQPKATALINLLLPRQDIDFSDDRFGRWDIAPTVGLGVQHDVGTGYIFGDVAYKYGTQHMVKNLIVDLAVKNRGFSFGIGYMHKI